MDRKRIVLDYGHGGSKKGAVYGGIEEKLVNLHTGNESYLVLWPLHLFGGEETKIQELAASGDRALDACLGTLALAENVQVNAEALILVSNYGGNIELAQRSVDRVGRVVVARPSAGYRGLQDDLQLVGNWVHRMTLNLALGTVADQ